MKDLKDDYGETIPEKVRAFLIKKKIPSDDIVLWYTLDFICRVIHIKNLFFEWDSENPANEEFKKALRDYQKHAKKLKEIVGTDVQNIASITIQGRHGRGSVTFPNNVFARALIDRLFHDYGSPLPPGRIDENWDAHIEYMNKKPVLVMPADVLTLPNRRQKFKVIVEASVDLAKAIYERQPRKNKTGIYGIIKDLLLHYHPDVGVKGDHAEERDFKKYLGKYLQ